MTSDDWVGLRVKVRKTPYSLREEKKTISQLISCRIIFISRVYDGCMAIWEPQQFTSVLIPFCSLEKEESTPGQRQDVSGGESVAVYFCGGLWAKVTPFSMLPLRPLIAASRRVFSLPVISPRTSMAFSAPLGCTPQLAGHSGIVYLGLRLLRARSGPRRSQRRSSPQSPFRRECRGGRRSWAQRDPWLP